MGSKFFCFSITAKTTAEARQRVERLMTALGSWVLDEIVCADGDMDHRDDDKLYRIIYKLKIKDNENKS
jgi:uncharacterized tellurite resistance protein B-like protein